MKLVRAHGLLGRTNQERRHEPFADRDMATLENGPDRNGELLAAGFALEQSFTSGTLGIRLRREAVNFLRFAMRANRTFGPAQGFKQPTRGVFIAVLLSDAYEVQIAVFFVHALKLGETLGFVKYNIPF